MPRNRRRRRRRAPPRRGARGPRGHRGQRGIRGPLGSAGPVGLSVAGPPGVRGIQGQSGTLEVNSGVNLTDPIFTLESLANVQNGVPPTNGELLTYENGQWNCSFWKAARDVYARCIDSVVNILQVHNGSVGSGSGFFVSDDGLILTASHVILADGTPPSPVAQELFVHVYPENQPHSATVIGFDRMYDVAIIKVPVTGHSFLELEDSRDAKPGEMLVTLGQPSGIHVQSVTMGVVRDNKWADRSDIPESIVSDYDTMGGNSGGAVINAKSKVLGILSWGLTYDEFSLSGAISSHVAIPIIEHIINNYRNNPSAAAPFLYPGKYLGISYEPVNLFELRRLNKLNLKIEGFLVTSSQTNQISTGTIITKVNNQIVGQNNNQVPLGTLIHLSASNTVSLTVRNPSNNYSTEQIIVVNLTTVPPQQDALFNAFQIHRKKLN